MINRDNTPLVHPYQHSGAPTPVATTQILAERFGGCRRGHALARDGRAVIAVQGLGYVTAHNWKYIARFGCRPRLSLFAGAALGPGFSRGQLIDQELVAEHDLTGNPAEAAATFGFGRMAWPGNAPPWVAQWSCSSALAPFASGTA